jgi:hypothetical protein
MLEAFNIIESRCTLPEIYFGRNYHDVIRELNPDFKFADIINPLHDQKLIHVWIRTTENILTRVNYYIVDNENGTDILNIFKAGTANVTPEVSINIINMTLAELHEKINNHDSMFFGSFEKVKDLIP